MTPSVAPALREALQRADFTYDAVAELLGSRAHDALARNETTPGLLRTGGDQAGSPLATLVRLFLLQVLLSPGIPSQAAKPVLQPVPRAGSDFSDLTQQRCTAEKRFRSCCTND